MFEFEFTYDSSKYENLAQQVQDAIKNELKSLTELAQSKVIENVSGKLLQKQTGALLGKIEAGYKLDLDSNPMVGFVGPLEPGPKEYALEKGGEREYPIYPTKATMLSFYWEKLGKQVFLLSVQRHPPSKEYGYLSTVAAEMEELIPESFQRAIDKVLGN